MTREPGASPDAGDEAKERGGQEAGLKGLAGEGEGTGIDAEQSSAGVGVG